MRQEIPGLPLDYKGLQGVVIFFKLFVTSLHFVSDGFQLVGDTFFRSTNASVLKFSLEALFDKM